MSAARPAFVVCEDGAEYVERFRRFLGATFDFVPAGDFAAALAATTSPTSPVAGLLLDLDFRRSPADRLVDEGGAKPAVLDEGMRRRLVESQGIFILGALRARGVTTPAVLFADLDDPAQASFLERTLAPLVVAPSHTGLRDLGGLLGRLAAR